MILIVTMTCIMRWWALLCLSLIKFLFCSAPPIPSPHKKKYMCLNSVFSFSLENIKYGRSVKLFYFIQIFYMGRAKRIWYLSPMRAAKVQASLRIRAVSPEPSLLAHTSSESRGTFRQKARSPAPLNGWACAVKICHDGMLEDTNSLGGAHMQFWILHHFFPVLSIFDYIYSLLQNVVLAGYTVFSMSVIPWFRNSVNI